MNQPRLAPLVLPALLLFACAAPDAPPAPPGENNPAEEPSSSPAAFATPPAPAPDPDPVDPGEPFEITLELLEGIRDAALPVLEADLGRPLPPEHAGIALATTDELAEVLHRENEPIMLAQLGDPDAADFQARMFAEGIAPAMLGKYAFDRHEILIVPEHFPRLAEMLGMPELNSRAAVRGLVVHELVHAFDDARHGLGEGFAKLDEASRIHAYNAVIEGHAQHVSRRVCGTLGWSDGFDVATRAIVSPAVVDQAQGEAAAYWARMQMQAWVTLYVDGETFIEAVAAAAGPEGLDRAFREPPSDLSEIHNPGWYLDPATRPESLYDLEAGLDAVAERHPESDWTHTRADLDAASLGGVFSYLGDDASERVQRGFRRVRLISLLDQAEAGHVRMALLGESRAREDAAYLIDAVRRLQEKKRTTMTEGTIRILSMEFEELDAEDLTGLICRSRVASMGMEVDVTLLAAFRDSMWIELDFIQEVEDTEAALELARAALDAASAPADAR